MLEEKDVNSLGDSIGLMKVGEPVIELIHQLEVTAFKEIKIHQRNHNEK